MTLVKFKRNSPTVGFDSMIEDFFSNGFLKPTFRETGNVMPSANIIENDKMYMIEIMTPGMNKEDIKIELEDNILSIKGERTEGNKDVKYKMREFNYQSFERSFTLPQGVEEKHIKAKYNNGILTLEISKVEIDHSKNVKTIKVG